MSILTDLSADLATIVTATADSVVRIDGHRRISGSGIVWSADGLIVTAHHVLREEDKVAIGLANDEQMEATVIGRDPMTDLALLRVPAKLEKVMTWVEPDHLRVGHLVLALGRPGRSVRAMLAIISALGESWRTPAGGSIDHYIQADTATYPGFSGGPLVTMAGGAIGINTTALLRDSTICIPLPTIRQVVGELLERGRISRGYLGVSTQPVRLPGELVRQLDQETGLLVVSVETDSPAKRAGLVLGDTIVTLGDRPIRHYDDLLASLGRDQIGRKAALRVVRTDAIKELAVLIGEHP